MERIESIEQYKEILKKYKKVARNGLNNNFLTIESVERYITLERIFCEEYEEELLIYTDEEFYYKLHYMGKAIPQKIVGRHEKPVLLRFIYMSETEKEAWARCARSLGLKKYDYTLQILANICENDNLEEKLERALRFVNRFGIKITYASTNMLNEIMALRDAEPLLDRYSFNYETDVEICEDIKNNYYRVAVTDKGEVIAAQHYTIQNGILIGDWLAVKEGYKDKYGIGAAIAFHSFDYAKVNSIKLYYGWVDGENLNSIQYHKSIGYNMTGKKSEGWLKDDNE